MSVDYTKVQLSSINSSNKVWMQGSGSFTVAALSGAGETYQAAVIPHGLGTSDLLYQVSTSGFGSNVILPWSSNDNRLIQFAAVDTTNLVIYAISSDSSGFGAPAITINYVYRILIP